MGAAGGARATSLNLIARARPALLASLSVKTRPLVSPAIIFSEKVIREAGTGKLSIINCFHRFYGREFPFAVPPFVVSVSFSGLRGNLQNLKLAVEVLDPNGTAIIPPVTTDVSSDADLNPEETFEISFLLPSLEFHTPGIHKVIFRVGEEIAGQRSLPAMFPPNAAPPPATDKAPATKSVSGRKSAKSSPR